MTSIKEDGEVKWRRVRFLELLEIAKVSLDLPEILTRLDGTILFALEIED